MKIMAQPILTFRISLSLREIEVLTTLASRHYDSKCRGFAAPDGLLTRVHRIINFHLGSDTPNLAEMPHTFERDECDTVAKITEMANYLPDESSRSIAMRLHVQFVKACQAFNEYYQANPAFEVGVQ